MRKGGEGGRGVSNHGPMVAKLSPVSGNIVNKGGGGMGQHGTAWDTGDGGRVSISPSVLRRRHGDYLKA